MDAQHNGLRQNASGEFHTESLPSSNKNLSMFVFENAHRFKSSSILVFCPVHFWFQRAAWWNQMRSKVKAYEISKNKLSDISIEISCNTDAAISVKAEEIEEKLKTMDSVLKSYKKLVFQAEAELKKDHWAEGPRLDTMWG